MPSLRVFTVDVEDPWQAYWHKHGQKVAASRQTEVLVLMLLDLLRRFASKATFFIVGTLAETNPDLVKEISLCGHEIALHGYHHTKISPRNKRDLSWQLTYGKKLLERISQQHIQGFRAPFFISKQDDIWLYPILKKCDFLYDSSIFANRQPYSMTTKGVEVSRFGLFVIPLPTLNIFSFYIPVCGGGYLRYLPLCLTNFAFRYFEKRNFPTVLYTHPYEFSDKPFDGLQHLQLTLIEKIHQWRIGVNCGITQVMKIERILADSKFNTIKYLIKHSGCSIKLEWKGVTSQ